MSTRSRGWRCPGIRLVGTGAGGPRATAVAGYRARPVTGIGAAVAVAACSFHRLALLADGSVRAWSSNAHGQLGDGTRVDRREPVAVCDLERVVAIAASGGGHSVALASDGAVHTWGPFAHTFRHPHARSPDSASMPRRVVRAWVLPGRLCGYLV